MQILTGKSGKFEIWVLLWKNCFDGFYYMSFCDFKANVCSVGLLFTGSSDI